MKKHATLLSSLILLLVACGQKMSPTATTNPVTTDPLVTTSSPKPVQLESPVASTAIPSPVASHTLTQVQPSQSPSWKRLPPPSKLPTRGMQAVFDISRNVIVLFGGTDNDENTLSGTWEYDGKKWSQITTAVTPPARFWFGMTYDAKRKVVVLFGGEARTGGGPLLNDTWEYDGQDWRSITTTHVPSARGSRPLLTYDDCGSRVILFGGQAADKLLNDTWEYDGFDWVQVQTAKAPPGRGLAAMVFDSVHCKATLFGGGINGKALNDTWEFDGENWVQTTPSVSPPGRWGHDLVYNPLTGHLILFGGFVPDTSVNDTWIYDGETWQEVDTVTKPSRREQHVMVFFGVTGQVFLIGGYGSDGNMAFQEGVIPATATPTLSIDPDCGQGWSRLELEVYAIVTPGDLPNRVRKEPDPTDPNNIIYTLYPGEIVKILTGPICSDGLVFWKVENGDIPGGSGWTAEGDGKLYYLEPYQP